MDENCAKAIAIGLRRYGIEVSTTSEVGLLGATDEEQLGHAAREGRVLFTQDPDFLRIHATGAAHVGIAYCEKDTRSVGEIIAALVLIWEVYEPDEMEHRVEYV